MNAPQQQGKPSGRLIPVTEWNEHHSWPPIGGLRHLIFHASTNGFQKSFKRVGKRILIDEDVFFECIANLNE